MKKIPHKYTLPVMFAFMLPTMLLGMPAVLLLATLPEGAAFYEVWIKSVKTSVPLAIPFILVAVSTIRLLVTKLLVAPKPAQA
ncbi:MULTISPECIES: DUF2798 domain-containing protein [unclassified Agarivorans]|uniref:DUF2798 domain-containing protein n=1 Tax=unclassified Agarivorans TaxID=2636026 RepID=UPI0026E26DF9|nr:MULTISPECIES: DUF2798 domain-containing protein [unclassified Agarivorans]MDO6685201.1 DUF2798 domain-containing protein [Agarivorans sp. 3_MG-2023]MDO6715627.1 DUF2798 domain-containing protein [Agarivorans sp. 2_MG-2023]